MLDAWSKFASIANERLKPFWDCIAIRDDSAELEQDANRRGRAKT